MDREAARDDAAADTARTALETLWSSLRAPSRRGVWAAFLAVLAGRLIGLAGAAAIASGARTEGACVLALAVVAHVAGRVLQGFARAEVEGDVYEAGARAVVQADVLELPSVDPIAVLHEGAYHATAWLVTGVPSLLAEAVACAAAMGLLLSFVPARVLVLGMIAASAAAAATVALRARAQALQQQATEARLALAEATVGAIRGRVEVVARGCEAVSLSRVTISARAYTSVVRRTAVLATLFGRLPLAAAVFAFGVAVAVDGRARAALAHTALETTVVIATALPVFVGLMLGVPDVARAAARLEPLLRMLRLPRRPEIGRGGRRVDAVLPVELRGVTFSYGAAPPALRRADVSWSAGPLLLVGPNGAGKSTALRMVLGLRPPNEGEVRVGGHSLAGVDVEAWRARVAYLPQRPYLGEPTQTVRDAMRMLHPDVTDDEARSALARTGVLDALVARRPEDALRTKVGELSAGQCQRVALARVLVLPASVLLLDEPDANLDEAGLAVLESVLCELSGRGVMVAVAAHARGLALPAPTLWRFDRAGGAESERRSHGEGVAPP
jgi:ABC-type multidrug transport system fused ATPase/permease subunit